MVTHQISRPEPAIIARLQTHPDTDVPSTDEHQIVSSMLRWIRRGTVASSPLGKALLSWAQPHSAWLLANPHFAEKLSWNDLSRVDDMVSKPEPCPHVLELADDLARLLGLASFDATLLRLMIACDRLPRVGSLARVVSEALSKLMHRLVSGAA